MYYAQINEDGICYAVTQTSGTIEQDDLIEIDGYDESLLGKRRTGDTWEDVPVEPEEPEEPVEPEHDRVTQLEQVIDTLLTGGETA